MYILVTVSWLFWLFWSYGSGFMKIEETGLKPKQLSQGSVSFILYSIFHASISGDFAADAE